MAAAEVRRETPWCAIVLVAGGILCQGLALFGNLLTASAMRAVGESSKGWSQVGLGMVSAMQKDIEEDMQKVSSGLLGSLEDVMEVQELIDQAISLVGNESSGVMEASEISLLQNTSEAIDRKPLTPMVMNIVRAASERGVQWVNEALHRLMRRLRPLLIRVGDWVIKFGPKVQQFIEKFSVTLDKVQKMFDVIMEQVSVTGGNAEELLNETFDLFDYSGTGFVSERDLIDVANLYSIPVLKGSKPAQLLKIYDEDGDALLNRDEFRLLTDDDHVPDIMPTVLRTYARRLSEISGEVKSAKMRDELSRSVVSYFQLVCANNMEKVEWVSDRLGNGSLPLEFTADVLAQMCLNREDPNRISGKDIGAVVMSKMYELHPEHTLQCVDLLSNVSFWSSEGFALGDQPACLETVTQWVMRAQKDHTGAGKVESLLQANSARSALDIEVWESMPFVARRLAEIQGAAFLEARNEAVAHRRITETSQRLALRLLGGSQVRDGGALLSAGDRAIQSGRPAQPATLEFAQWLANNASANAHAMQAMCFEYSSQSSGTMDAIADQVQGLVKKSQAFVEMMMEWATPSAIDKLDALIDDFVSNGLEELSESALKQLGDIIAEREPILKASLSEAAHVAADEVGREMAHTFAKPIAGALVGPLGQMIAEQAGDAEAGKTFEEHVVPLLNDLLANNSEDLLAKLLSSSADELVEKMLNIVSDKLGPAATNTLRERRAKGNTSSQAMLLDISRELKANDDATELALAFARAPNASTVIEGASFEQLAITLRQLGNLLPTAIDTLNQAQTEAARMQQQLGSMFTVFKLKGPALFDKTARVWEMIWIGYFVCGLCLSLAFLYYAFWSGGFFGGPMPIDGGSQGRPGRLEACVALCRTYMSRFHDTRVCLFSAITVFQLIVLGAFLVSVVMFLLAGVKILLTSGCAQVYALGDDQICGDLLGKLALWLESLQLSEIQLEQAAGFCERNLLATCKVLSSRLKISAVLTTTFSFLAAMLSAQLLVECAVLHEAARWRRIANKGKVERR